MNKLKISTRLAWLTGLLCLLLSVLGALSLYALGRTRDGLKTVYEDRTVPAAQLAEVRDLTRRNQMLLLQSLAEPAATPQYLAELGRNRARIDEVWRAYIATYLTPEEKTLTERFKAARGTFLAQGIEPAITHLNAGRIDEARRVVIEVMPAVYAPLSEVLDALVKLQLDVARSEFEQAESGYRTMAGGTAALVLASLALAAAGGWLISRGIAQALGAEPHEVKAVADAVAAGRFDTEARLRAGDTTSVMAAMRSMCEQLSHTVSTVRQAADGVATSSAQIAAGNSDLSTRTEQQSSALQQTAASMEQLAGTVSHNADNARQASLLASGAATLAEHGGHAVGEVVQTMQVIADSARRIGEIITVIDGIAFQTNILALNAAVEAARAGEQGRGFAVVAGEVRALAKRSADAARDVRSLVGHSVAAVERGSELVERAGRTMGEIVQSVREVTGIVTQISDASREQSDGVTQINQAVAQMDQVTQQNAALVEESAAAAESLRQQADQVAITMAAFTVRPVAAGQGLQPVTILGV